MDEIRRQLREAADAHRPDRGRMLARVERAMAPPPAGARPVRPAGSPASWVRIAGATAAVAGVLVAGGYAVASATRDAKPVHSAAPPPTAAGRAEEAYLRADGLVDPHSNRYWAQSNVRLNSRVPLTALTVELRVAQTGGVAETGRWCSLPLDDFTVSVREEQGALIFRWTLRAGRTIPAGQHVFAGQYNHAEGVRDTGDDAYSASAMAGTDDEKSTLHGDFTPAPVP